MINLFFFMLLEFQKKKKWYCGMYCPSCGKLQDVKSGAFWWKGEEGRLYIHQNHNTKRGSTEGSTIEVLSREKLLEVLEGKRKVYYDEPKPLVLIHLFKKKLVSRAQKKASHMVDHLQNRYRT